MKIDLIEYITTRTPKLFLQNTLEALDSAYYQAYRESLEFDEPERFRMLPQLRHYRQNAAFRDSGHISALQTISADTLPRGEAFPIVICSDINYGRISVNFGNRTPRLAKHRLAIAAVNGRFEEENQDFFSPLPIRMKEGLGALIVTVNPHSAQSQDLPAKLIVGIPYTNCKGWHLYEPFESVMAAYSKAQQIEVADMALVSLKKKLSDKE